MPNKSWRCRQVSQPHRASILGEQECLSVYTDHIYIWYLSIVLKEGRREEAMKTFRGREFQAKWLVSVRGQVCACCVGGPIRKLVWPKYSSKRERYRKWDQRHRLGPDHLAFLGNDKDWALFEQGKELISLPSQKVCSSCNVENRCKGTRVQSFSCFGLERYDGGLEQGVVVEVGFSPVTSSYYQGRSVIYCTHLSAWSTIPYWN